MTEESGSRAHAFPIGAAVTLEELERDPHPVLHRLRAAEPVSWVPALDGWLVTRRDLALRVMRDDETFTVDDPRFSTAQIVGPSMLSLDGDEHARHRDPFADRFRLDAVRSRFTAIVEGEVDALLDAVERQRHADLRRDLAGPLSAITMAHALGLENADPGQVLDWYAAIVTAVTEITAGRDPGPAGTKAFGELADALEPWAGQVRPLRTNEAVSNAAVLLFGGIETTEAMIANAFLHLLSDPEAVALVRAEPALLANAVEESLRLEPGAAVVDRYTVRDVTVEDAAVRERELVRVSLAGANRDPAVFTEPDRFDVRRENARLHAAFAQGPHVCLGMHLARLEAQVALRRTLERLPGLRLDPERPAAVSGLVFRKPDSVEVVWGTDGGTLSS